LFHATAPLKNVSLVGVFLLFLVTLQQAGLMLFCLEIDLLACFSLLAASMLLSSTNLLS
jgi:hypothetical protein